MYAKHFFRTCGNSACTHLALGIRFRVYIRLVLDHLVRKTYHIYMHSDPNSACTKKVFCVHAAILHVHIWRWEFGFEYTEGGFWTTLYEKHTISTCTRTPILHVRKTRLAYMQNYPNSACTQITFFVHAAILHVHIWRWEFGFGFDCTQNTRNNQRSV